MRTKHTFFVILFIGFLYFLWQQQVYFFLTDRDAVFCVVYSNL